MEAHKGKLIVLALVVMVVAVAASCPLWRTRRRLGW